MTLIMHDIDSAGDVVGTVGDGSIITFGLCYTSATLLGDAAVGDVSDSLSGCYPERRSPRRTIALPKYNLGLERELRRVSKLIVHFDLSNSTWTWYISFHFKKLN